MIGLDALISFMKHPAVRELPLFIRKRLWTMRGHKAEIRMIKKNQGGRLRGMAAFPISVTKDKYDIFPAERCEQAEDALEAADEYGALLAVINADFRA